MQAKYRAIAVYAFILLAAALPISSQAQRADEFPVLNEAGIQRYWIILNEAEVRAMDPAYEAATRAALASDNAADRFARHRPPVRALVRQLETDYGITAVLMTSYIEYSFCAFVPPHKVETMRGDPRISKMTAEYRGPSGFSSWSDYNASGPEVVPWGKQAIGTDDSNTTSNIVYFLDGVAMVDGGNNTHSDLNIIARGTVNLPYVSPGDPYFPSRAVPGHANHVAGILGADLNGIGVRGVNDYAPLINVYVGDGGTDGEIVEAMDWALGDAETRGIFAIANMSLSGTRYAPGGALNSHMRRLSTRFLVVESAGNTRQNACSFAYGPTNPNDGILVIGGIDSDGNWAAPYDNSASGGQAASAAGTNWGGCIEAWGPSKSIVSTWSTGSIAGLSGTSMAAPHVAALAARHGGSSTRPVERENYIRAKLFNTGYNDENGQTIKVPSYTQSPSFTIPSRLSVSSAIADATQAGTSTANLYDGLYLTGFWSAGHGAPAWTELDLGSSKTLTSVRLTPEQTPAGSATHTVYVGSSSGGTGSCAGSGMTLVATLSGNGGTMEPFVGSFSTTGRYVRVCTTSSVSWVAWREIEVYGY